MAERETLRQKVEARKTAVEYSLKSRCDCGFYDPDALPSPLGKRHTNWCKTGDGIGIQMADEIRSLTAAIAKPDAPAQGVIYCSYCDWHQTYDIPDGQHDAAVAGAAHVDQCEKRLEGLRAKPDAGEVKYARLLPVTKRPDFYVEDDGEPADAPPALSAEELLDVAELLITQGHALPPNSTNGKMYVRLAAKCRTLAERAERGSR